MPACRSLCRQFSRNSYHINTGSCVISLLAIKHLQRSDETTVVSRGSALAWRRISSLMLSCVSGRAGMVAMLDQRRGRTTGFSTTSPKSSLTCVKNTYRTRFPIWRRGGKRQRCKMTSQGPTCHTSTRLHQHPKLTLARLCYNTNTCVFTTGHYMDLRLRESTASDLLKALWLMICWCWMRSSGAATYTSPAGIN